jgi:hypothetical protein
MMQDGVISRLVDPTQRAPARLETRTPPVRARRPFPSLSARRVTAVPKVSRHREAQERIGHSEIHRRSVKPVKDWLKRHGQQSS